METQKIPSLYLFIPGSWSQQLTLTNLNFTINTTLFFFDKAHQLRSNLDSWFFMPSEEPCSDSIVETKLFGNTSACLKYWSSNYLFFSSIISSSFASKFSSYSSSRFVLTDFPPSLSPSLDERDIYPFEKREEQILLCEFAFDCLAFHKWESSFLISETQEIFFFELHSVFYQELIFLWNSPLIIKM